MEGIRVLEEAFITNKVQVIQLLWLCVCIKPLDFI